jgi:predicted Zn-dependent peptidase
MTIDRSRLPQVGADPAFRFPAIEHSALANGLKVRTVEHASVPVVSFVLVVEGGSGSDPAALNGLAAIAADMLDEGTGAWSAIDVSDALARIGAEYDVDVGSDVTVFSLTTLTKFAGRGAALLADMVTRPAMRASDFDRVRRLRLDRLKQLKDMPPAVAERAFLRLLYGTHPYGHLPIGSEASLMAMTLDDVVRHHAAGFRPDRATLVIAGDMTHRELLAAAEQAFADWKPATKEVVTSAVPDVRTMQAPVRLAVVPREGAAQSEIRLGQLAARRSTPDYFALLVMNAVLGGQFVSRIMLKLREEKGFTYGARTAFDWKRGLAPFSLQTSVQTRSTAEAIQDSLAEFEALRGTRPPTDEEMTVAKASLTRGYPRNFETAQQVARSVAQLALYDLPDSYFEEFTPAIQAVTPGMVVDAARTYLDPAALTTLVVGDHVAIAESLQALGLGDPRILNAAE